jgi:hypothetical protein
LLEIIRLFPAFLLWVKFTIIYEVLLLLFEKIFVKYLQKREVFTNGSVEFL